MTRCCNKPSLICINALQGPPGVGNTGATGATGEPGEPGAVGDTGATGPAGTPAGPVNVNQTFFVDEVYGSAGGLPDQFDNPYQTLEQAFAAYIPASGPATIFVQPGTYTNTGNLAADGLTWHFEPNTTINVAGGTTLFNVGISTSFSVTGYGNFVIPVTANTFLLSLNNSIPVLFEADTITSSCPSATSDVTVSATSTLSLTIRRTLTCSGRSFISNSGVVAFTVPSVLLTSTGSLCTTNVGGITSSTLENVTNQSANPTIVGSGQFDINNFVDGATGYQIVNVSGGAVLRVNINNLTVANSDTGVCFSVTGAGSNFQYTGKFAQFVGIGAFEALNGSFMDVNIERVVYALDGLIGFAQFLYNNLSTTSCTIQDFAMTSADATVGIVLVVNDPVDHTSYIQKMSLNNSGMRIINHTGSTTDISYVFDSIVNVVPTVTAPLILIQSIPTRFVYLKIGLAVVSVDDNNFVYVNNANLSYDFGNIDVSIANVIAPVRACIYMDGLSTSNGKFNRMNCTNCSCINNQSTSVTEESTVTFGFLTNSLQTAFIKGGGNALFGIKGSSVQSTGAAGVLSQSSATVSIDVDYISFSTGVVFYFFQGSVECNILFGTITAAGDVSTTVLVVEGDEFILNVQGSKIQLTTCSTIFQISPMNVLGEVNVHVNNMNAGNGTIAVLQEPGNPGGSIKFFFDTATNTGIANDSFSVSTNTDIDIWISGYINSGNIPINIISPTATSRLRLLNSTLIARPAAPGSITSVGAVVINNQGMCCSNLAVLAPVTVLTVANYDVNVGYV